jgi:hypothetical protein
MRLILMAFRQLCCTRLLGFKRTGLALGGGALQVRRLKHSKDTQHTL